jgi:hypothetical protein
MRTVLAVLPLFLSTGCLVYSGGGHGKQSSPKNEAPLVEWADASCYWDEAYRDDVWWFEADVADADGLGDVVAVYADVYDGFSGEWVDAFELFYDGGNTWYSAWQGRSTYLDCGYYDYIVDFVPEDVVGEGQVYTLDLM